MRHHLGIGVEVWKAQESWYWLVARPGLNAGAIGAAATEAGAMRDACWSIEEIRASREDDDGIAQGDDGAVPRRSDARQKYGGHKHKDRALQRNLVEAVRRGRGGNQGERWTTRHGRVRESDSKCAQLRRIGTCCQRSAEQHRADAVHGTRSWRDPAQGKRARHAENRAPGDWQSTHYEGDGQARPRRRFVRSGHGPDR